MLTTFLLKGILIGFSIAAPVGPIGVLCIRRTLAGGRLHGLASGLGAATADTFYGCVAGFGLTFISSFLVDQQVWLRLVGGLFLCYLGVRTLLAPPAPLRSPRLREDDVGTFGRDTAARASGDGLLAAYGSTLFLTLTNPVTILAFAAIFAGLGVAAPPTAGGTSPGSDYASAGVLVLGVFVGSAAWWFILSGGVSLLRAKLTPARLIWVNRLSGLVIIGFGVAALASLAAGL